MKRVLLCLFASAIAVSAQVTQPKILSLTVTNYSTMGLTYSNICRNTNYMKMSFLTRSNAFLPNGYYCDVSNYVTLKFTTVSNRYHQILSSPWVSPPCNGCQNWEAVSASFLGNGKTNEFHHGNYGPNAFYKIVVY